MPPALSQCDPGRLRNEQPQACAVLGAGRRTLQTPWSVQETELLHRQSAGKEMKIRLTNKLFRHLECSVMRPRLEFPRDRVLAVRLRNRRARRRCSNAVRDERTAWAFPPAHPELPNRVVPLPQGDFSFCFRSFVD